MRSEALLSLIDTVKVDMLQMNVLKIEEMLMSLTDSHRSHV